MHDLALADFSIIASSGSTGHCNDAVTFAMTLTTLHSCDVVVQQQCVELDVATLCCCCIVYETAY